ncbi:hypothetical protein V493_01998 [Pseudogymnoascus sp. VKM F-4281 (FW-2241)]|nr:hypothetical protein V493_01998 [Pseudogymnoascus sp. VKM F-4281 (FW-2241)]
MLFTHATIVTVDASRSIYVDGAILVQGNKIADIGTTSELKARHTHEEEIDLTGRIIIPGLISTHMHTAQTLLRGTGDDLELVSWLCDHIWVMQGNFTAGDGYAAARLSIAEMLLSGTTTFLESMFADRYGFDGLCNAVTESGIRGCLGKIVMDIATYAKDPKWAMHPGLVEDREMSLLGALAMHEKWDKAANDRIRVWFGARTPGGVSDDLYKEMTALSRSKNIPITMHCAEVKADRIFFDSCGHTPMSYCESVGLLGPQTVLAHMVHLDDSDIQMLAETKTNVAHCPTSNAKLASGICRVPDLQKAGVNIGLGTDGAPCNNTCDLLQEMKLAAIIHKSISFDPTAVPAEDVLEMATINGAKALGLADQIGSLEVGKKADFVAIDMRKIHLQPWFNPVSAVVYSATGRDVEMTVVDGRIVVQGGKLLTMNEEEIMTEAQRRSKEVVERAGLTNKVKSRWADLSDLQILQRRLMWRSPSAEMRNSLESIAVCYWVLPTALPISIYLPQNLSVPNYRMFQRAGRANCRKSIQSVAEARVFSGTDSETNVITQLQQHTGNPSSKDLRMHFSLFTTTILLLLASFTAALPSASPIVNLETRQQQQASITCEDYARLANYTAINSNATLRAAFLQASPQGTNPTRVILDRAFEEFNANNLKFDTALNAQCGNLSTVSFREVDRNFSLGVVAGWKVVAPTGARIGAGVEVWCSGLFIVMFTGLALIFQ